MKYIFYLFVLLLLSTCVEQLEFTSDELEDVVVVDGYFSAAEGIKTVRLTRTTKVNSQLVESISGAKVCVEDDAGTLIPFVETGQGVYQTEARANDQKQYRLNVELPDGRKVNSTFQRVPDSVSIAAINIVDTLVTFLNESGNTQRLRALEFFANANLGSSDEDLFLRFSTQTVYQVLETVCGPFHTPKACYFYNDERPFDINLIEIDQGVEPSQIESMVLRREINYQLAEIFALELSLLSYNEEEFDYWRRLKQLFEQQGNINDVNPARLVGNMASEDGFEVLGLFAVVGESRKIKLVRNSDFPTRRIPFCGIPENRPWPLPDACCDCLNLSGASLLKPDYWP